MKIGKVNDSRIITGIKRLIKFLGLGSKDVQEVRQLSPFGIDSAPIKDMVAVYSETSIKGESVVIGYFNKSLLADKGDFRTYSMDDNGGVQFYIWQKKNGTCEIGGNTDNMVRFSILKESYDELKEELQEIKNIFNTWVPVPSDGGLALKTLSTTWASNPLIKNIDGAKINEIKTL